MIPPHIYVFYVLLKGKLFKASLSFSVMIDMDKSQEAEILLALHRIEDRLQEMVNLLKVVNEEALETSKERALGTPLRKKIYELCNGKKSVGQIAIEVNKSIQQVSNNIALLQNAGMIREVQRGGRKEKYYIKAR